MWMTIQQYADKQGISYQGAYKAFKKYGADLMTEGHVKEEGRTTMIDGYAADFLASKRRSKGSSLARSVEYEAMAKQAVKTMPKIKEQVGLDDLWQEFEDIQEEIENIQEKINGYYGQIAKMTSLIKKANKEMESIKEKSHRIMERIRLEQKNQDVEAMKELIGLLYGQDSEKTFKSIQFPRKNEK